MKLLVSPAIKIGLVPSAFTVCVVSGSNEGTPLESSLSVVFSRPMPFTLGVRPVAKLGSPSSNVGIVFVRSSAYRKDTEMQTQVSEQCKQPGRIAGVAMVISRAAFIATLLTWAPSSIGSANDNPAPAKAWAGPAQAAGAKEATAEPGNGSGDLPTRPMCAGHGGITSTQVTAGTGESGGTVACGVGNNLAGGSTTSNQEEELVDVATFLAWHVQARSLSPYAFQATPSPSPLMKADRS